MSRLEISEDKKSKSSGLSDLQYFQALYVTEIKNKNLSYFSYFRFVIVINN